ncbi:hypothetical protein [Paenibacillus sp. LjRoot56]
MEKLQLNFTNLAENEQIGENSWSFSSYSPEVGDLLEISWKISSYFDF